MTAARDIVRDVLGRPMADDIWTGNYFRVLPISIQDFDLSAILPAVFYMFRFGERRGKGRFLATFGPDKGTPAQRRREATVERVARRLAENQSLEFEGKAELAILGDLLLCFCLENRRNALGRTAPIQRVAPAHYMASWIDLPDSVGNLRQIPEMIVSTLADQPGKYVEISGDTDETPFPVCQGHERNVLLRAFRQGVEQDGPLVDPASDRFVEQDETVGLDQLLMIRLAKQLRQAPDKLRGTEGRKISNQRPVSEKAAAEFSEDIRRFVRSWSGVVPRHGFLELLESGVSLGLTTIVTSAVEILLEWSETGRIMKKSKQSAANLFVDCSNGMDRQLRTVAEQSLAEFLRRVERFPVILMMLRLLDWGARDDRGIRNLKIATSPSATEWLDMLGDLLRRKRPEADRILYQLDRTSARLADNLEKDYPETAWILKNDEGDPDPVRHLAEALVALIGGDWVRKNVFGMIDSALLVDRPNGMASRRSATRADPATGRRRRRIARSLVFTDPMLDYMVHTRVLETGGKQGFRALSLRQFLREIRERYGLHVDSAPPGMPISGDLLRRNRTILERRLRDLGLLSGVNDAEAMKRLRPRFRASGEG